MICYLTLREIELIVIGLQACIEELKKVKSISADECITFTENLIRKLNEP